MDGSFRIVPAGSRNCIFGRIVLDSAIKYIIFKYPGLRLDSVSGPGSKNRENEMPAQIPILRKSISRWKLYCGWAETTCFEKFPKSSLSGLIWLGRAEISGSFLFFVPVSFLFNILSWNVFKVEVERIGDLRISSSFSFLACFWSLSFNLNLNQCWGRKISRSEDLSIFLVSSI